MVRHTMPLETVSVSVPETALEAFEAAFATICETVGFFHDQATGIWRVEGVKEVGAQEAELTAAIALAEMISGVAAVVERAPTQADGWLARTYAAFPEQFVGRRFAIRGTHQDGPLALGRITLTLDAGVAFGSGEHGSTRGCLIALEDVERRRPGLDHARHHPARILDMGTGSGILAIAAAALLHQPVLATDIEPWAIRVTRENAAQNGVGHLIRPILANGWRDPRVRGPFDLVFANILARPLCRMAHDLALNLAPNGTAILAGLLASQVRWVLGAHRRQGLALERLVPQGIWTAIVLRRS